MNPEDRYRPSFAGWLAGAFGYAVVCAALVWIALWSMAPPPAEVDFHADTYPPVHLTRGLR
jgi:hypothetical protein